MKTYTYLAIGDSYTIGEQETLLNSFPYQAVQLLRAQGYHCLAPEIIAATGWTTSELKHAIDKTLLLPSYDFISLLIGVNNQYRGNSGDEFRLHVRALLEWSIAKVNGEAGRVIVMSIPDWGVTPFAEGKERAVISSEIDVFNFIFQAEAAYYQTIYIDITASQRLDAAQADFLASDQLHPSAREYAKWAEKLCEAIKLNLS